MIDDRSRANAAVSIGWPTPDSRYARMNRHKPLYNGARKARDYLNNLSFVPAQG
jgi:hypothetical protein